MKLSGFCKASSRQRGSIRVPEGLTVLEGAWFMGLIPEQLN